MGYTAWSGGDIYTKVEGTIDKVIDILKKYDIFDDIEISDDHGRKFLEVSSNSRYHEEDFQYAYKEIAPYLDKASIEFAGEDDSHWKHEFKDGQWNELNGKIVYTDPVKFVELDTQVEQKAEAKMEVYENMTEISDSMFLPSGKQIAYYEDPANDIYLSIEVCGEVSVAYKEENYYSATEFPEELKEKFKDGSYRDDPDIVVNMNNWYEMFMLDEKGHADPCNSWLVECDHCSNSDIESLFEDTKADILKGREDVEREER